MSRRKTNVTEHHPLVPQVTDRSRAGTMARLRGERGTFRVHEECLYESGKEYVLVFQDNVGFRTPHPSRVIWPRVKKGTI